MESWEGTPARFAFVCADCGHRFAVGGDAGPIFHCERCEGLSLNQVRVEDIPACDFCIGSRRENRGPNIATWRYPCDDFVLSVLYVSSVAQGHSSAGDWAACDVCHDRVEKGLDYLVVAAALNLALDGRPDIPAQLAMFRNHWQGFYDHRTSEATRL